MEKKSNWPITTLLRNNAQFKNELDIRVLQKLPEEKEMDSSTVSEKNVTFDFDTAQQSFTTFGNEDSIEETSDNLDWFGNETRKLHEKR